MVEFTYFENSVIFDSVCVIADTHIGFMKRNTNSNSFTEIQWFEKKVRKIVNEKDIEKFVIAGDVFDEFKIPNDDILSSIQRIRNFLEQNNIRFIITLGNHDAKNIQWNRIATTTTDEYTHKNITILHGHREPKSKSECYIVGHIHPNIKFQQQKWRCYLFGKNTYKGSSVLILPTFNKYISGPSIHANYSPGVNFPFIKDGFGKYKPIIWGQKNRKIKKFPQLEKFNEYLEN